MQHMLWDFFYAPGPLWLVAGKYIFLLFPALLAVAAVWCTQLSVYTFPFRSGRAQFIPTMMLTWWDAVRAVWLYWVGMFRLVGVALGWVVAFGTFVVKLVLEVIRQIALMPFTMKGRAKKKPASANMCECPPTPDYSLMDHPAAPGYPSPSLPTSHPCCSA